MKHALQAVILTGVRRNTNPLLQGTGLHNKVLLPVGGKPMVQSVLETLAASRYSPEIYISTNDPDIQSLAAPVPFKTIPSESKAAQSFLRSLERVPGKGWVLFASGDHPLLTPEMVDYFIEEVMRRDLTLGVAMVSRELVDAHYPQTQRTYLPVRGGEYSGGNLYLVNKQKFLNQNERIIEMIDENRKNPLKSIKVLDPISMLQILLRRLDLHEFAQKASKMVGCRCGFVEMPFAECCMDVDKPSDKDIAEMILARRRQQEKQSENRPQKQATIA